MSFTTAVLYEWLVLEPVGKELRWKAWEGSRDGQPGCSLLINMWVIVALALGLLSVAAVAVLSFFMFYIGEYEEVEEEDEKTLLGRLLRLLSPLAVVVWDVLGLVWVIRAELPCVARQRRLLEALQGFFYVHIALTVAFYLRVYGRTAWRRRFLRPGAVKSPSAATLGRLERSAQPVTAPDALLRAPCCPICLDDFDDAPTTFWRPFKARGKGQAIVATRTCQHVFHKQCLQEWLEKDVTCPLCRRDVRKPPQEAWPTHAKS